MNRKIATAAACAALAVATLAACQPNDTGTTAGPTAAASSAAPHATGQSVIGNGDPNALPDAKPVASPPKFGNLIINPSSGYDCHLYLNSASGIVAGGGVLLGNIHGFCTIGQPAKVTTLMYLQAWSPALGRFASILTTRQITNEPPDMFPGVSNYKVLGYCGAGIEYRIYARAYGTGRDGSSFGTPNADPNLVDAYTLTGNGIRFTADQCVHGGGS